MKLLWKPSRIVLPSTTVAILVILAACGSSTVSTAGVVYRDAEQVQILPKNLATPTSTTPISNIASSTTDGIPAAESSETEEKPVTTSSTIPLDDETDPIDDLFASMKIFNDCLKDKGTSFLGIPTPGGDPTDPVNDSQYIESLIECAAVSQIQDALQTLQSAGDDIPADEIEGRNRGLVHWGDCLKGRGWKIGEFKPDARGLLQIPQELTPPQGETLLESDDMPECRDIAVAQLEEDGE